MSEETRAFITWALGTLISLSVIIGLLVKFMLLPWLRDHLVAPVKQVEKQVTENEHRNESPTIMDRIDDVEEGVKALARVIDGHMEWSEKWVDLIEREMDLLRREGG